jgi:RHS repeat-associated protein
MRNKCTNSVKYLLASMGLNESCACNFCRDTVFGYTGQRALPDTGLMDYKARFYDPALNRFLQPDSIVSNPLNPQTWNRYSYVNNSPVNFTDPSGHRCAPEDECDTPHGDLPSTPHLGENGGSDDDPVELNDNGNALKSVLDRLNMHKNWWNNYDITNQLSVTDLMVIILSAELKGVSDNEANETDFSHAATHWFWDRCRAAYANCSGPTDNAILNWMGDALQSAKGLFGGSDPVNYDKGLAYSVAGSILGSHTADPEWQLPITNANGNADHPIHWGNEKSYYELYYGGQHPLDIYQKLGGDDPFYLIPYTEEHRMCLAAFGSIFPCPPQ